MLSTPAAAIATNHSAMIGPKRAPTWPVPRRWIANSATRIVTAIGSTTTSSSGSRTVSPSTADNTEIAGVMTASP